MKAVKVKLTNTSKTGPRGCHNYRNQCIVVPPGGTKVAELSESSVARIQRADGDLVVKVLGRPEERKALTPQKTKKPSKEAVQTEEDEEEEELDEDEEAEEDGDEEDEDEDDDSEDEEDEEEGSLNRHRVSLKEEDEVEIPEDWQSLSWNPLRRLASDIKGGPIQNRKEAEKVIKKALAEAE